MFKLFKKQRPLEIFQERRLNIKFIDTMEDSELQLLNRLLPWSSYVLDSNGRIFGKAHSKKKRNEPEIIPDPRIIELHHRFDLTDKHILELGCFEGNHTIALSQYARSVSAIDARIESVVKTITRTAMFGYRPEVFSLNLEETIQNTSQISCDVLHHVGVLYHLSNPMEHLNTFLPHCEYLMLDTHVAACDDELETDICDEVTYRFKYYKEAGRAAPFAGMANHAKWLPEEDLINILRSHGFTYIDVAQRRQERNGPRILIYASKKECL